MAQSENIYIPIAFAFRPQRARWELDGKVLRCDDGTASGAMEWRLATKPLNAWLMREEFFRLKVGNTKTLLAFLNKWGAWCLFTDPLTTWDRHPRNQATWRPQEIWHRQQLFLEGVRNPEWWLSQTATNIVTRHTQNKFPYQMCLASSCEFAMRMTITIDLLNEVKFRICARPDCFNVFAVTDPRKRYCEQYCAHIVSVRNQRADAKTSELSKGPRTSRTSGDPPFQRGNGAVHAAR